MRTCAPAGSVCSSATPAAMPEANASAPAPPSRGERASSRSVCVGFDSRMYVWAPRGVNSASRSNVVDRYKGGATEPVAASGRRPACTASVSNFIAPRGASVCGPIHSVRLPLLLGLPATLSAFPLAAQAPTPSKPDVGQGLKRERERLANYQWRLRTQTEV